MYEQMGGCCYSQQQLHRPVRTRAGGYVETRDNLEVIGNITINTEKNTSFDLTQYHFAVIQHENISMRSQDY